MRIRTCKKCGADNLLQAKKCYNCGAGLGFSGFMQKIKTIGTIIGLALIAFAMFYDGQ